MIVLSQDINSRLNYLRNHGRWSRDSWHTARNSRGPGNLNPPRLRRSRSCRRRRGRRRALSLRPGRRLRCAGARTLAPGSGPPHNRLIAAGASLRRDAHGVRCDGQDSQDENGRADRDAVHLEALPGQGSLSQPACQRRRWFLGRFRPSRPAAVRNRRHRLSGC